MSFITGTNTIIKENLLAKETVRLLDKKFVIMNYANTEYEGEIKQQGDTVSVQTFPNIAWSTGTTAGADITASPWTISKETLTVDQLAQLRVEVTNVEEIQSNLSLREKTAERMAYGQAELLEKFIVKLAVEAAGNSLGAYGTALTNSTVIDAISAIRVALSKNNAFDMAGLFIDPTITALFVKSSWFDGFKEGLDVRRNGFLGRMLGFEVYETNNIGYKVMLAMDKYSVHFAAQWIGFKIAEEAKGFRSNILGEIAYGGKVFTENAKRIATYAYSN